MSQIIEIIKNPIVPTWLAAIGTLGAVIYVIFKDTVIKWYNRPILTAECLNSAPHTQQLKCYIGNNVTDAFYYRILVHNKGKYDAKNVEVFVTNLYWWNGCKYQHMPDFLPMNLCWANRPKDDQKNGFVPKIPKKSYRHCDLGHVKKEPKFDNEHNGVDIRSRIFPCPSQKDTIFNISKLVPASNFEYLLGPKQYCFEVQLTGDNCNTVTYYIILKHNGKWSDSFDEMINNGTCYMGCTTTKPDIHVAQKDKKSILSKLKFWKRKTDLSKLMKK